MLNQLKDNEELQSAVARLGIRSTAPPLRVFRITQHPTNPAKGLGWFAKEKIQRGTPLLAEKALFEVVGEYTEGMVTAERDRLSQSDQEEFGELVGPSATSTPKQIFDRNAFEMHSTQQRGKKMGLFLETFRLNHSCKANAYWTWNRLLRRLTVYAMAEIPVNDEITISYCPPTEYRTRIQRDTDIFQRYGFHCDCTLCQHQLPFGAGSDARRSTMRKLKKKLVASDYLPDDVIQRLQDIGKFENLIRQEGLIYPMLADICRLVAEWYRDTLLGAGTRAASYENGHRLLALEFARKELDLDVACTGHKSPEVTKTLTFIRLLKS